MAGAYVQNWSVTPANFVNFLQSNNPNTGNPVVGNAIVVSVRYLCNGSVSTVTDAYGNTYVKDVSGIANASHDNCEIWRCKSVATTGANFWIKVTMTALANLNFDAAEFSGTDSAAALAGSSTGTQGSSGSTPATTGTFTTTKPSTLCIICVADDQLTAITPPAGFAAFGTGTTNGVDMDGQSCYEFFSTIQTNINPQWSGQAPAFAGQWVTCAVAIPLLVPAKPTGSGRVRDLLSTATRKSRGGIR